jgi:protease-4
MSINGKIWIFGMYCLVAVPAFAQNVYLELNLGNQALQNRVRSGSSRPPLELFRVIEKAGKDKRIGGIIVNAAGYSASQEHLWELRLALQEFKSHGKKICAFISAADIDLYTMASVADTIVMDELGVLALFGYAWGRGYVLHTLDKIGAGVRELRYFKYKSAAEMFTRDSISEEDRMQYGEWLDDIFMVTRDTLVNARSWTPEQFDEIINNGALFSARDALQRGLVDRIGREAVIKEAVNELEGKEVKSFVCYGNTELSITGTKTSYSVGRAGGLFNRPPVIAVVYANGQTDMEQGMAARSLSRTIRKISENRRVKAIVLRINSPGGSAEAADYIAEAVKFAQKKMPVVVSMGSVAASGGYWAAMYANEIVASPYTLTGSIGVIGSWFYDKGLNEKLGLTVDVLQRGDFADLATGIILPRRDLKDEEVERYQQLLMDMYDDFVSKVAAGRSMDLEKVEAAAQGRVYSGIGALNAGLIDKIGGLNDAIAIARNLANISPEKKIEYQEFPKPKFFDKLLERTLSSAYTSHIAGAASNTDVLIEMLFPEQLRTDLLYRIANNGKVMPLLPVDGILISR